MTLAADFFPLRAACDRLNLPLREIREVILGCVAQPSEAQNVARVAALRAGFPKETPAVTVHRNCASGLEAVTTVQERLAAGGSGISAAGGTESMSSIPLLFPPEAGKFFEGLSRAKTPLAKLAALSEFRPGFLAPRVGLIEGLTDCASGLNMGETAENLRRRFSIPRAEADAFAARSHVRALAAKEKFRDEIAPYPTRDGFMIDDNGPRADSTPEKLATLRPVFDKFGEVTAGNSSQVTDGACGLVVADEATARARNLPALGRLLGWAYVGCDPAQMGLGPAYAIPPALAAAGVKWSDVGLVEINEAFAVQVLACDRALGDADFCRDELGLDGPLGGFDWEKTNVNGGGIALGHPVGTTGARLVLTLLLEMRRRGVRYGVTTLCVGGGQGAALVWESEG